MNNLNEPTSAETTPTKRTCTSTNLERIMAIPPDREIFDSQVPKEDRESTTFCRDFLMAELYGVPAIKDTYRRAFSGWKRCHKYLTELCMTLNHRLAFWFLTAGEQDARTKLYNELWMKTYDWGRDNLKGEELLFFESVLD